MAGRKLETFEDFSRALKNKYGVGEGELYKPWYRVQDVMSRGVRSQIAGLKTNRIHHTLSSIETEFFYLVEYSDSVIDIREQFPLLPINLSIKIAKSLDIEHPAHPKTKTPIIVTTDFLITRMIEGKIIYEAVSVKPEKKSDEIRVLEKIELERVWWDLLGVKFSYFVGNELTLVQSNNINWATHPLRSDRELFSEHDFNFALSFLNKGKYAISDICDLFVTNMNMRHENAFNMLRCLIGTKRITVDLSYSLEQADFIDVLNIDHAQEGLMSGTY